LKIRLPAVTFTSPVEIVRPARLPTPVIFEYAPEVKSLFTIKELDKTPKLVVWTIPATPAERPPRVIEPVLESELILERAPELTTKPLIVLVEVGPTYAPALVIEDEPVVVIVPVVEIAIFEAKSPPTINDLLSTPPLSEWTIPEAPEESPPRVVEPVPEIEVMPERAPALIIRELIVLVEVGPTYAPPLVIDAAPVVAIVPVVEIAIFEARSPPTIRDLVRAPRVLA